ncbi:hypothetical protein D1B31_12975 [Neobacillus notoginsengisoli]|uniref:Sortilin N-terminal domain-containing protein n=1 Tax=Neobacillus notoginsengisoli TaxID=1578198 RepID=A0A417YSC5_9BACI|nr:hypothetical protein [Neobacillus notoginsengisoli]RHW38891.1 hypothetical protein D1B31_12975 [Neobacillus notoginsengisoli]
MKKITVLAGVLTLGLVITGCSSASSKGKSEAIEVSKGFKAEHLHGVAYSEDQNIYIATHEGMLATDGGQKWTMKGNYDFDFMGYNVMSDGTMISSGHPGKASNLPNPLGFMVSKNNGEKWEPISLLGKVDFHILSSNFSNPDVIYGINQMDSGNYKAGIYKSTNKGKDWELLKSTGLPQDLHTIYSIVSMPNDENILLAGTDAGILKSEDGGMTWGMFDQSRLITAFGVLPDTKELIGYSITNQEAGIMTSADNGQTWENKGFDLGQDAVAYFGVNPKDSKKIAISTFENSVFATDNGGENWTPLMDKGVVQ